MGNLGKDFADVEFVDVTFDRTKFDPPSYADSIADLANEISRVGGALSGSPTINGEIQRLAEHGKKTGDDAIWYVAHELDNGLIVANFGNWRSGENCDWNSRGDVRQLTATDRSKIYRAKLDLEDKQKETHKVAAENATKIWTNARSASTDHPYLIRKKIAPHGVRQDGSDLIVPVYIDGEIVSIQRINSTQKRFLAGGQTRAGYFRIGEFKNRIIIAEGFATGASVHEATGEGVIIAFNAGNLLSVANALREKYKMPIIIAGDDDRFTDGNPGRGKAESVAMQLDNVSCLFPTFANDEGEPTDFNDLHCREGLEAVQDALLINADATLDGVFTFDEHFDPTDLPTRAWIIEGLLLRGYVTAGVAPPGVGKSTFAAMIAIMVATGWEATDA